MDNDRGTATMAAIPGWRIMRSDAGRLWASREQPFLEAVEKAGAARTVDGDTPDELATAVAAQEDLALQVAAS
ncbi:hypothetical protein ACQP1K_08005 [Sphaerimonospora sp. CA-214678]|uniref:hypothetical protein n=1 Tax=Sphaerimonospora sp. CA-214678 TaxID=3240029 RepID=UPI003D933CCE